MVCVSFLSAIIYLIIPYLATGVTSIKALPANRVFTRLCLSIHFAFRNTISKRRSIVPRRTCPCALIERLYCSLQFSFVNSPINIRTFHLYPKVNRYLQGRPFISLPTSFIIPTNVKFRLKYMCCPVKRQLRR